MGQVTGRLLQDREQPIFRRIVHRADRHTFAPEPGRRNRNHQALHTHSILREVQETSIHDIPTG